MDLASIKALQASFEPTADEDTLKTFRHHKDHLELSIIHHFEKLRRSMIESLAGVDYE